MNIKTDDFSVDYHEADNIIKFSGSLRLLNLLEYEPVKRLLLDAHERASSALILDFRELKFLNSSGITAVSTFVIAARKQKKLSLRILGSKDISWQDKSLQNLNKLWSEVVINME
jgi:hypothetical protein